MWAYILTWPCHSLELCFQKSRGKFITASPSCSWKEDRRWRCRVKAYYDASQAHSPRHPPGDEYNRDSTDLKRTTLLHVAYLVCDSSLFPQHAEQGARPQKHCTSSTNIRRWKRRITIVIRRICSSLVALNLFLRSYNFASVTVCTITKYHQFSFDCQN